MPRSFLTDEMWIKLAPWLPPGTGGMGRTRLPNRLMVEAILWRHRTGAPWWDLPEAYGPWTSGYTRFDTWNQRGVWQGVLEWLRRDADLEWVRIDGTIVRAHQHSAETLLWGWKAEPVLGDRAHDGGPVREVIAAMEAKAVIPPHPCRKKPAAYDPYLYKARHAIENGFAKLKQARCLATRFDKTARSFAAQVAIACIVLWLRL